MHVQSPLFSMHELTADPTGGACMQNDRYFPEHPTGGISLQKPEHQVDHLTASWKPENLLNDSHLTSVRDASGFYFYARGSKPLYESKVVYLSPNSLPGYSRLPDCPQVFLP